ncbi:phage virion morphogenesis protein [Algicola sagamiensis]|uniref:phage virion morphogenesis protein n=1 Tax=Algicola sagamiensis TaxID=163869 RepID=UPI00037A2239|nr:phage virion morphogenesis protein [Algicola sagamiensis]
MITSKLSAGDHTKQLELLLLDPRKRRRILRGAGRKVRRDSRKRLRSQRDLTGSAWQARSNGKKQRMLKKLGKHIQVHTTPNQADVTFGNRRVGQVARLHQEGVDQQMSAAQLERYNPKNGELEQATRSQAISLRRAGYRIRKKRGKGWKTPTIRWIQNNLNFRQAGLILRMIRDEPPKKEWTIPIPERAFLGQDENEHRQLTNYMLDEAMRLK